MNGMVLLRGPGTRQTCWLLTGRCPSRAPPPHTQALQLCNQSWVAQQHVCDGTCGRCTLVDTCLDLPPPFEAGNCTAAMDSLSCSDPFIVAGEVP
jgi:hypothetical protein